MGEGNESTTVKMGEGNESTTVKWVTAMNEAKLNFRLFS